MGWRIEGEFPNQSKLIVVVAPHTSNTEYGFFSGHGYCVGARFTRVLLRKKVAVQISPGPIDGRSGRYTG